MATSTQPSSHKHLSGECQCARNQFVIAIPPNATQHQTGAHVFFDNSLASRRAQATPITAWLRIPLAWYHSNTQAYYPDESHASIRRTFYTPAPLAGGGGGNGGGGREVRKQFCGYCGTHLSAWREEQEGEGEWMDVTLGSLLGESLEVLEDLGWLDGESSSEDEEVEVEEGEGRSVVGLTTGTRARTRGTSGSMSNRGMPYFEELVEDSRLGKIKRRRGGRAGADGSVVEWEVTELEGDGDDAVMREVVESSAETGNGNKRLKLGD